MHLVEELTQKHNSQQMQMENINAENQILRNQLTTLSTQAAYSYYYNPYAEYATRTLGVGSTPCTTTPKGRGVGKSGNLCSRILKKILKIVLTHVAIYNKIILQSTYIERRKQECRRI